MDDEGDSMAYFDKMTAEIKAEFDRYVSYISGMDDVLGIYLFGSYAYGEPTENSDIDISVVVRDGVDTLKMVQEISRGLCDRRYPIDVVADNISSFERLSEPGRCTLQREVKDRGVLVYG